MYSNFEKDVKDIMDGHKERYKGECKSIEKELMDAYDVGASNEVKDALSLKLTKWFLKTKPEFLAKKEAQVRELLSEMISDVCKKVEIVEQAKTELILTHMRAEAAVNTARLEAEHQARLDQIR